MIGGSFVVPLGKRDEFYIKYYNEFAKWLNDTTIPPSLFLTEWYNDEYFRFVDIDYEWDASPPPFA